MFFTILIILLILIPTLIAALLFSMAWILKYNPAIIMEYQELFINGGIVGGIILSIPLLIGIIIFVMMLWEKSMMEKSNFREINTDKFLEKSTNQS